MSYLLRVGPYAYDSQTGNGWFRLWRFGPGIHWKCTEPLFSERVGTRMPFLRLGKWRIFYLPRDDIREQLKKFPSRHHDDLVDTWEPSLELALTEPPVWEMRSMSIANSDYRDYEMCPTPLVNELYPCWLPCHSPFHLNMLGYSYRLRRTCGKTLSTTESDQTSV